MDKIEPKDGVGYFRSSINPRMRDINFYLEKIRLLGWVTFDCIKVYDTEGDITPPFPFQFQALCKPNEGDDDPWEGVGSTPLKAVKDLWQTLKSREKCPIVSCEECDQKVCLAIQGLKC